MNTEELIQLTYGTIVQLDDVNKVYKDQYFFITYICKEFIDVISNEGMKKMQINIQDNKLMIEDNIIYGIRIYFQPNKGYAELNHLYPGTSINIVYIDGSSFEMINGTITYLEEDQITVQNNDTLEQFFIDFEYAGLDKSRIVEISIVGTKEERVNTSNVEDNDEIEINTYDMEEEISNYVEKMSIRQKNKKIIINEIKKYFQLIDLYTDLNQGKLYKLLPKNQVTQSFLYLNEHFFYPYSSQIHREIFNKNESLDTEIQDLDNEDDVDEKKSVLLQVKNAFMHSETKHEFVKNLTIDEIKKNTNYARIRPLKDTPIYLSLLDNEEDLILQPRKLIHSYLDKNMFKKNQKNDVYNFYKTSYVSNIIVNGVVFHSKEKLQYNSNIQNSQTILSKTIQNCKPYYLFRNKKLSLKNSDSFINSRKRIIYPFTYNDQSKWNQFSKRINMSLFEIYNYIKENQDVNFYEIIKKLGIVNVEKLHKNDMSWCLKSVQNNRNQILKNIEKSKSFLRDYELLPYQFVPYTNIYTTLCESYGKTDCEKSHSSELIHLQNMDQGNYLIFLIQQNLNHLKIDLNDPELIEVLESLNKEIDLKNKTTNTIKYTNTHVKTYVSLQELQGDQGKIILKDPYGDHSSFTNNTQYLYSYLQSQEKSYSEPIEVFNDKLQELLVSYSPSLNDEDLDNLQIKLFENRKDIFDLLIHKIIELKVRPQDRCYVEDTKEYYVYNNNSTWVKIDVQEENIRKKKVLRIQNTIDDVNLTKESILEDYAKELIQQLHNERTIELEKKDYLNKQLSEKYAYMLLNMKKQIIENILKYNKQKQVMESKFDLNEYLSNIVISPYTNIMYEILGIENLDKKYSLIQDFISYLTIDIGDKDWYFCALKKTKLIPKFLNTLSVAYFDGSYHEVIKNICLTHGTISDSGDCWIHKNTGMKIQNIYFDTNYGYDENGFKIVLDEVKDTNKLDGITKIILLTPEEMRFSTIVHAFLNFIGVGLKTTFEKDKNKYIKEIYGIFLEYKKRNPSAKRREIDKRKCYVVVGFLLAFFQCNEAKVRQSFPGCLHSFQGYPLENDKTNLNGIEYLSCILSKVSKKNTNHPYDSFNKMNISDIVKELYSFIKSYIVKNPHIASMINTKRQVLKQNYYNQENQQYVELQSFKRFSPSLMSIQLKNVESIENSKKEKKPYDEFLFYEDLLSFQTMRLQYFFQKTIKNELPLLTTQLGHPFLINYCCQDSEFITKYLCKSTNDKNDYENIQKLIENYDSAYKSIQRLFLLPNNISFIKTKYNEIQTNDLFNDEMLIYAFFIHYGNFDNDEIPISSFLETFIKEKPSSKFYDKNSSLKNKIKILKENGYIFTHNNLISALQFKSKINANQVIFKEKSINIQTDLIENINSFLNIDLLDTNIETTFENEIKVIEKHILMNINAMGIKVKQFQEIKEFLEKVVQVKNIESHILYLNQSLYALLISIPEFIISEKLPYINNVYCEHWNLASKHNTILKEQTKNTFDMFESIEFEPGSNEYVFLNYIQSMKEMKNLELFKKNDMLHFIYLQFIFYKILLWYSMFSTTNINTNTNMSSIKSFNESLYEYLIKIKKFNVEEYNYAKMTNKKLKESEKQLIIKSFQNMKKDLREVEDLQKNLGLGKWAYGKGKSFLKYDKRTFDDEERRAGEVHEMMDVLYNMENQDPNESSLLEQSSILEQSIITEDSINEQSIQRIIDEEREPMMLGEEDDERYMFDNENDLEY